MRSHAISKVALFLSVAFVYAFASLPLALSQDVPAQGFTVFDAPGAGVTFPTSINASGDVTGWFKGACCINGLGPGFTHGFVRDRDGSITVFDGAPNALFTQSISINDKGDVAGFFSDGIEERGFVRDRDGNISVFDPPNATSIQAFSINASGDVTGSFSDASQGGKARGFVRDRGGNITVFDVPNSTETGPCSINASGEVTGEFRDPNQGGEQRAFVRDQHGTITVFDGPNASQTASCSINDRGDVAGEFFDVLSVPPPPVGGTGLQLGFVRDRDGNITAIDAPGAYFTVANSINDSGEVTGQFSDSSHLDGRGFVLDRDANISVFDAPNASYTEPASINARGDVAGSFGDASQGGKARGFIRSPQS